MKKINFEESLKRLEEITERMESREITLDESLKLFEEGVKLSRFCESRLSDAQQKLEILKSSEIEDFIEEDESADEMKSKKKKKTKKSVESESETEDPEKPSDGSKASFLF